MDEIIKHSSFHQIADLIDICLSHGAEVAEIREVKANEAIMRIRQDLGQTFIIGSGNDEAEEGKWIWASDGQLFKRQYIDQIIHHTSNSDQPFQNFGPSWPTWGSDSNCLTMVAGKGDPKLAGTWQSKPCKTGKKILCEAKVVSGKTYYSKDALLF